MLKRCNLSITLGTAERERTAQVPLYVIITIATVVPMEVIGGVIMMKAIGGMQMNADNDADDDGLLDEELTVETPDEHRDSDGDGICDNEDLHPTGGGRKIPQHFKWTHDGKVWIWTYSVPEDWYAYYRDRPRASQCLEYVTKDDSFIQEVAKSLKGPAEKEGYTIALYIGSFVQALPYVKDSYTGFYSYQKYPVETLVERNGDCEDTSYLAASIIDAAGFRSALVRLTNHVAIAIKAVPQYTGYYYELYDGRYYYFETTGEGWELGEIPDEYVHEQAKVTRIWDGGVSQVYPKYQSPRPRGKAARTFLEEFESLLDSH